MSIEDGRQIYGRWIEGVWNGGDMRLHDELVAPECIDHNPLPAFPSGRAGLAQLVSMLRAGHDDLRFVIDETIADGDRVLGRWTMTGVHAGPVFGVPATRRPVRITGMDLVRVRDGRIVEIWHNEDALGHLMQIGAIPGPPGA